MINKTQYKQLLPDASNLIESQRSMGYTFETALADIIDNSISSEAKSIDINFRSLIGNNTPYIAIMDDGNGMSAKELMNAMKYGSSSIFEERSQTDLGRFGLGLKMASFSQCRRLTVISKKNNEINGCQWDLDYISEKNSWLVKILNQEDIQNYSQSNYLNKIDSGTIVIWEVFDRLPENQDFNVVFDEQIEKADNHIALVFHRFISEKKIKISLNGQEVDPIDPYFILNKASQPLEEDYIGIGSNKITVKPYIVPYQNKLSQKEKYLLEKFQDLKLDQGLYIYRNKRLISWGKWFRLVRPNELSNLAKIQIDIPNSMDTKWQIDVKKSTLSIPLYLRNELKRIIAETVGKSIKVYQYRGKRVNSDDLIHVFNRIEKDKKISYQINNENPLIVQLQDSISDKDNRLLKNLLSQIEDNIPLESIRYDLASKNNIEINSKNDDESYEEIMDLLSNFNSAKEKKKFLKALEFHEAYREKRELLRKIEDEYDD
ncbi:ATP-binding protein [Lactococcus lactis]|uniref:ATP-binding protein n=1 Tax=Lactococcus lactis TaxID=1358 RepID=UPI0024A860D2|nr:ATP-binding protein [Lactococcus lactis]